ncbi:MAG: zinc-ribbon domain containing protein [Pirellulaceae bacterium]|nr:zinc-ribbon domain containing protein [Pirellulaceae bacterium]
MNKRKKREDTGRDPSPKELREAERILSLSPFQQKNHPTSLEVDYEKLDHVRTYGILPDYYIDRPFTCRKCGKRQIWKAKDQKWYYEEAKGNISAIAVECHECRKAKKQSNQNVSNQNVNAQKDGAPKQVPKKK